MPFRRAPSCATAPSQRLSPENVAPPRTEVKRGEEEGEAINRASALRATLHEFDHPHHARCDPTGVPLRAKEFYFRQPLLGRFRPVRFPVGAGGVRVRGERQGAAEGHDAVSHRGLTGERGGPGMFLQSAPRHHPAPQQKHRRNNFLLTSKCDVVHHPELLCFR